ncbi:hypothetical protein, partial [Micromonospora carbonacea]|uniref:hypothetical protein n=1 Tax=Micromonospora carbonacea TaxID=47853 RepID=UPI0037134A9E
MTATFDCCPAPAQAAGIEAADEIISGARRQAAALPRQARADVSTSSRTAPPPRPSPDAAGDDSWPGATPAPSNPTRGNRCAITHLHDSTPQRRAVRRSVLTRSMTLLKPGDAAELEILDLDVETKEAHATTGHDQTRRCEPRGVKAQQTAGVRRWPGAAARPAMFTGVQRGRTDEGGARAGWPAPPPGAATTRATPA